MATFEQWWGLRGEDKDIWQQEWMEEKGSSARSERQYVLMKRSDKTGIWREDDMLWVWNTYPKPSAVRMLSCLIHQTAFCGKCCNCHHFKVEETEFTQLAQVHLGSSGFLVCSCPLYLPLSSQARTDPVTRGCLSPENSWSPTSNEPSTLPPTTSRCSVYAPILQ